MSNLNKQQESNKYRAKLAILGRLLSFPTISPKDWEGGIFQKPKVGDLVALQSAPDSKWYVSWVVEIDFRDNGWNRWLLESIEDGHLCWWENVGFTIYKREELAKHPEWRWTDKQFELRDRWHRVFAKQDAYLTRPGIFAFNEDGSITLGVRERHNFGEDNFSHTKTFPEWKKVTIAHLTDFYIEGDAVRESRPRIKREAQNMANA
jgi:hypothetical protein